MIYLISGYLILWFYKIVEFKNESLPLISISPGSIVRYNSDKKIIVNASVISEFSHVLLSWSCTSLNSTYLASISSLELDAIRSFGSYFFPLAFIPGGLSPGILYTFELRASYVIQNITSIAVSSVSIMTNEPPSSGAFSVNPEYGYALNTVRIYFDNRTYIISSKTHYLLL